MHTDEICGVSQLLDSPINLCYIPKLLNKCKQSTSDYIMILSIMIIKQPFDNQIENYNLLWRTILITLIITRLECCSFLVTQAFVACEILRFAWGLKFLQRNLISERRNEYIKNSDIGYSLLSVSVYLRTIRDVGFILEHFNICISCEI